MKILFLLVTTLLSQAAWSANCFDLSAPALTYIVSDNNPAATGTVSIIRTSNSANCNNYFLGFSKGGSTTYTRRALNAATNATIEYNIFKNSGSSGLLKDKPDITSSNETFIGTIARNQTITHTYYFVLGSINASSPPRYGDYTDTIVVHDYHGTWNGSSTLDDSMNLNITINVPKMIQLALIASGDVFDSTQTSKVLDFGELELNEELGFDIKLVSNAGYNLLVSSANNGKLKNTTVVDPNGLIDYEFYANNVLRGLSSSASSPVSIASGTGVTPAGGATVPIRVKIGSVSGKIQGDYEDTITVTVVSTD